jgi:hypothetical protein
MRVEERRRIAALMNDLQRNNEALYSTSESWYIHENYSALMGIVAAIADLRQCPHDFGWDARKWELREEVERREAEALSTKKREEARKADRAAKRAVAKKKKVKKK